MGIPNPVCPSCGSEELHKGYLGTWRQPFAAQGTQTQWDPSAYACLDCGLVSHFLGEVAVKVIRKQAKRD